MAVTVKRTLIFAFTVLFLITFINSVDALCVKVPKANIRTGPGTNYDIAWEVYKYMPFTKVGVSLAGDWYAVKDVDGDVNWIYKNLLSGGFKCAVVKSDYVNVRTGPGTNYQESKFSPAERYQSFRVLKRQSPWVKVKDELGNIGWIHSDYLWIQ